MQLSFSIGAALCFAIGGLFMKASSGVTRMTPVVAFLALFLLGALLQALAMRQADMGTVYLAVLGLEAVMALVLSVVFLQERLTASRILAMTLVLGGVVLLKK